MVHHLGIRSKEKSFGFFPQVISARDGHESPEIIVKSPSSWSYLGPLLHPSRDSLPESLHRWLRGTLEGELLPSLIAFLIRINEFLQQKGLGHYWLTIRATNATSEYDCPRWHNDEYFFDGEPESEEGNFGRWIHSIQKALLMPSSLEHATNWKLCGTIVGPSTLFIPEPHQMEARQVRDRVRQECSKDHVCPSIRCVGCATAAEAVRHKLGEDYVRFGSVQPQKGQFAFFRVGSTEGAMHSEPKMDCDRIFVNVVPGTEDELKALASKWGVEYPRSWSFRVVDQRRGYVGDLCEL